MEIVSKKLFELVDKGNVETVSAFLNKETVDINVQDILGNTAIFYATRKLNSVMIKFLIEKKANVNHQNKGLDTALHILIQMCSNKTFGDVTLIVQTFISSGASLFIPNLAGITVYQAIKTSEYLSDKEDMKALLEAIPNVKSDKLHGRSDFSAMTLQNTSEDDYFDKIGEEIFAFKQVYDSLFSNPLTIESNLVHLMGEFGVKMDLKDAEILCDLLDCNKNGVVDFSDFLRSTSVDPAKNGLISVIEALRLTEKDSSIKPKVYKEHGVLPCFHCNTNNELGHIIRNATGSSTSVLKSDHLLNMIDNHPNSESMLQVYNLQQAKTKKFRRTSAFSIPSILNGKRKDSLLLLPRKSVGNVRTNNGVRSPSKSPRVANSKTFVKK